MEGRTLFAANLAPEFKPRGKARPDRQLSKVQIAILVWLFERGQEMGKNAQTALEFAQDGVPWDAKRFSADKQIEYKKTNISTALRQLCERRKLVSANKRGATTRWVRLTLQGQFYVDKYLETGKTPRQLEEMQPRSLFFQRYISSKAAYFKYEKYRSTQNGNRL